MHPKFEEFIIKIRNLGFNIKISTNATKLNDSMINTICENADRLHLSFYAISEESYNIIQGDKNFSSTKRNIERVMEISKDKNIEITLNFIAMKYNDYDFKKYKQQFDKYSHENVKFSVVRISEWESIYNIKSKIVEQIFPEVQYYRPCKYINDTLAIDWNGDVMACCMSWDIEKLKLGVISDETSIKDIWNNNKHKFLKKSMIDGKALKIDVCANCNSMKYKKRIVG